MIEFEHVYKSYSDTKAVLTDVSLKIETGELFTLIGSSGCGKTTLLKTINKLNTFEQGELRIDGRRVQDIGTAVRADRICGTGGRAVSASDGR